MLVLINIYSLIRLGRSQPSHIVLVSNNRITKSQSVEKVSQNWLIMEFGHLQLRHYVLWVPPKNHT